MSIIFQWETAGYSFGYDVRWWNGNGDAHYVRPIINEIKSHLDRQTLLAWKGHRNGIFPRSRNVGYQKNQKEEEEQRAFSCFFNDILTAYENCKSLIKPSDSDEKKQEKAWKSLHD